jgi:enoyl-CoA hydratase/carnithine racemase
LRADGDNFSFGGDIAPWPDMTQRELRTLFERWMTACNRFERLSIPTVAAIQGLCAGGGLELALRADVVFAGQTARFGHPEQSIGIVTLLGGIYRVAERAGRSRAIEWALTSEQVPAATMERHGVINRVGTYACARRP